MASKSAPSKKVRLACQRCRTRRIKCDGEVPACSNCAKVGAICIDIDSQNADVLIPRNFANAARARIRWLEDVVRDRLPDVDLTAGPQVDFAANNNTALRDDGPFDHNIDKTENHAQNPIQIDKTASRKRVADENNLTDNEDSFPEGAQSVAFNLGMLSLNSDSIQKHYLGSSSGVLFTNIIGASPSPEASGSSAARTTYVPPQDLHQTQAIQTALQLKYQSLHQILRRELPPKNEAAVLLQTFLLELHPDYPVLEPSSLASALEALYDCITCPLENDPLTHGWPRTLPEFQWNGQRIKPQQPTSEDISLPVVAFIFFMIFNVAAIVKVRARVYEYSPEKFYRAALFFAGDSFAKTSLSSIQSLVILMIHSLLTPADMNLWTLVHVAMAHCVELGIHREPTQVSPNDEVLQQIKRFTFYVIYSFDRTVATIQGRPLGLRDEAFDASMPIITSRNGSLSMPLSVPPSFISNVTYFSRRQFQLDRIVSDIKTHLYHLPKDSMQFPWPSDPTSHQARINQALILWWDETKTEITTLPGLDTYHKQLWTSKMKIRYHTTIVLLFQPSQVARNPDDDALQTCFDSACAILQGYQLMQEWRCLQYGWRAVQNIFAAGATIVYTFWSSKSVQRNASATDLSKALRSCSSLLSVGGEWWPSVRKGKSSFETVVDLTIRKLYMGSRSSKQPRIETRQQQSSSVHIGQGVAVNPIHGNMGATNSNIDALFQIAEESHHGPFDQAHQSVLPAWPQSQNHSSGLPDFQADQSIVISYAEPSPDGQNTHGMFPEVEDFLADFDNSDFSWNMPLYGLDEYNDFGLFLDG